MKRLTKERIYKLVQLAQTAADDAIALFEITNSKGATLEHQLHRISQEAGKARALLNESGSTK